MECHINPWSCQRCHRSDQENQSGQRPRPRYRPHIGARDVVLKDLVVLLNKQSICVQTERGTTCIRIFALLAARRLRRAGRNESCKQVECVEDFDELARV